MSSTLPKDDKRFGDAYPAATTTQLNVTDMNDITADNLMDHSVDQSLEKTKKVGLDMTGRSNLNAASKRSDQGLNG